MRPRKPHRACPRRGSAPPTPARGADGAGRATGGDGAPHTPTPSGGGRGRGAPLSTWANSTPPHAHGTAFPQGGRQRRGGDSPGAGNDTTGSASGTWRDVLERSRSTNGGARPGAERGGRTAPPRHGEGRTRDTGARAQAERVRCVRRPRPRQRREAGGGAIEIGPGSAPLPYPRAACRRAGEARGPRAEREERSHSPGMSVPRLARLRPGPGERDVTTSIGTPGEAPGAQARRGRWPAEPGLLPSPPPPSSGASVTGEPRERGTPATRGKRGLATVTTTRALPVRQGEGDRGRTRREETRVVLPLRLCLQLPRHPRVL